MVTGNAHIHQDLVVIALYVQGLLKLHRSFVVPPRRLSLHRDCMEFDGVLLATGGND